VRGGGELIADLANHNHALTLTVIFEGSTLKGDFPNHAFPI
jgi:hypothetical protein